MFLRTYSFRSPALSLPGTEVGSRCVLLSVVSLPSSPICPACKITVMLRGGSAPGYLLPGLLLAFSFLSTAPSVRRADTAGSDWYLHSSVCRSPWAVSLHSFITWKRSSRLEGHSLSSLRFRIWYSVLTDLPHVFTVWLTALRSLFYFGSLLLTWAHSVSVWLFAQRPACPCPEVRVHHSK